MPHRKIAYFGEGKTGHIGRDVPGLHELPDHIAIPVHWCRGGKGASLAAMSAAGLPVPPGFTLCVDCCRYYHENGKRWPDGLEDYLRENMAELERITGRKFGEGADPLLVSVRSGAAVSMPGMMDTLLNCGLHKGLAGQMADADLFWSTYSQFIMFFGKTIHEIPEEDFDAIGEEFAAAGRSHEDVAEAYLGLYTERTGREFPSTPWQTLVECIDGVFDSWQNERANIYRKSHNIRGLYGTAVNVQSMWPSRVSGIAFTENPSAPQNREIVLESAYGLGEAIVSGMVTPDRFVLDRETLEIKERVMGEKGQIVTAIGGAEEDSAPIDPDAASITDEQAVDLARLAMEVEEYFGFAVDIEWGISGGEYALLQSRAVRGLDIANDVEVGRKEEVERLRDLAGGKRKVWVVHNLSETLPTPTPLTWDIQKQYMSGNGGYGRVYTDLGYRPSKRAREEGFLDVICGRIYADLDAAAEYYWEGMPQVYDLEEVIEDPHLIEAAPTKFDPEKADGRFLLRLPGQAVAMLRSSRLTKRARTRAAEAFTQDALPPFMKYLEAEGQKDPSSMSTADVIGLLDARIHRVMDEFGPESLKPGFFAGMALTALEESLIQLMGEEKGREVARALTSGLEGDTTTEQNAFLFGVARGEHTLDEYVERYGHRAVGEVELSEPRYREDTGYLERLIETYGKDTARSPEALHSANRDKRLAAEEALPGLLAEYGGSAFLEELTDMMREAQTLLPYRESGKHYLMMGYELIRSCITELGDRWDLGSDVFFLRQGELRRFEEERDELKGKVAKRKIRWQSAKRLDHPEVIDSDDLDALGLPRELESAAEFKAVPLASGIVEGTAHIVFSPQEAGDLGTDCILVCPSTDPAWTALFVTIVGVIVERGGVLSHGAITARDFGIPAVSCPDATKLIKAGSRIRIDGDRGQVNIVEEA